MKSRGYEIGPQLDLDRGHAGGTTSTEKTDRRTSPMTAAKLGFWGALLTALIGAIALITAAWISRADGPPAEVAQQAVDSPRAEVVSADAAGSDVAQGPSAASQVASPDAELADDGGIVATQEAAPDSTQVQIIGDGNTVQLGDPKASEKLDRIEGKVDTIAERATANVYRPPPDAWREAIVERLRSIRQVNPALRPSVFVDQGDANRHRVALDMIQLLKEAGFEIERPSTGMTFASAPLAPIAVTFNPVDEQVAKQLLEAFTPWLGGRARVRSRPEREASAPMIQLHGVPAFASDGSVRFD
jgi:hypothetical protein